MKRFIALIITFVVILTCFAGCKKGEPVESYTDFAGKAIPAVTKEGGNIVRDDNGNVVVYVTDPNGNTVEGENGEPETQAQAVEHAIVTGTRIEMPDYALNIPDGWSNVKSYDMLNIVKDDITFTIMTDRKAKLADMQKAHDTIVSTSATGEVTKTTQKIAGQDATVAYTFSTMKGNIFVGYIDFMYQGVVFSVQVSANSDISSSWNEIVSIVNTIEFVH
ncbi:MAG: hypothetical protein IKM25_07540 [Clostridia bacterium]|nr:hypothetical protein [Clostridia bacterium]